MGTVPHVSKTFTWEGYEIPCAASSERKGEKIELGGGLLEIGYSLTSSWFVDDERGKLVSAEDTVITSSMRFPADGDLIEVDAVVRKVVSVTINSTRSLYTLAIGDPDQ